MMDVIIQEWMRLMESAGINAADIRGITAVFYAGDELAVARDHKTLQDAFNILISLSCQYMQAHQDQHAAAARSAAALRQCFTAHNEPLKQILTFKYLGCIVVYDGIDVPAARHHPKRMQAVWGHLFKDISKKSMSVPAAGMFYQAVVAAVLLYGSESCVLPFSQSRMFPH